MSKHQLTTPTYELDTRIACSCGQSLDRAIGLPNFVWVASKKWFTKEHFPWLDNETQSARLLAAIQAAGILDDERVESLSQSSGLTLAEIDAIFYHADLEWGLMKERF